MTDIVKCEGKDCPLKDTCYRYTSKASMVQSYFIEIPYKDGECEFFWPTESPGLPKSQQR